uniref:Ribosomal protein S10 n=1 Tax=Neotessella volvocina TaxID=52559 RepID=A0A3G2R022_9STRA|nr:ribosomal protein S10 [Neotessella volvocina]
MKFRIFLKSFDNDLINNASKQIRLSLEKTDCELKGVVSLPVKCKRFCVLRSPHIDKDSREHFEIRFYKRFIDLQTESPSVIDLLLKTELPAGVSCSLKIQ